MKLEEFKKAHKKFSKFPLAKELAESSEHAEYTIALQTDKKCGDWFLTQAIKKAGMQPSRYCCLSMAYHLIEDKETKRRIKNAKDENWEENYDSVITYNLGHKSYGLPIHDGGSSFITINYCPWCGKKLSIAKK